MGFLFGKIICLLKIEIEKFIKIMAKFPEVDKFSLIEKSCGIGGVLLLQFNTTINEVSGTFSTEISGVETW